MTYNWEQDAKDCYALALRMLALQHGFVRFRTLYELYWQEQHGVIP